SRHLLRDRIVARVISASRRRRGEGTAKCYLIPPLPGGRECVWERGLGGEGLRRPAHPRPTSAAAIPTIHGSSAPPPPKSTSRPERRAGTSVGGDGSALLDWDRNGSVVGVPG